MTESILAVGNTMRTREEQITELTEMLYEAGYRFQNKAKPEAERIILQAERRAEQRVRAQIGRDSERLDWLEDIVESGFRVSPVGKGFTGASFNHGYGGIIAATLRSAIDAAREVG